MAGQGRLDPDPGGLGVPDLADHDHVGVGTEHRAQPGGEVEPRFRVDVDLVDPLDLVLDRVLDRDHVLLDRVERRRAPRRGSSTCPSRSAR